MGNGNPRRRPRKKKLVNRVDDVLDATHEHSAPTPDLELPKKNDEVKSKFDGTKNPQDIETHTPEKVRELGKDKKEISEDPSYPSTDLTDDDLGDFLNNKQGKGTYSEDSLSLTLKVWRQSGPNARGRFETYLVENISEDMSFLEMFDVLNENLINEGIEPVEIASDCREGICGTCGCMINGKAHGPEKATATCQLHMRKFKDGDTIVVEPWQAASFPIIKDLVVDRSPMDRIIESGGFITVPTGSAPDANLIPVPKDAADTAFDAAACIGCGACVAACPNSAAQLFTSAKVQHLNLLPQGQAERWSRTEDMVEKMEEYFGSCTNHGECHEACPKEIPLDFIAYTNRDYVKSKRKNRKLLGQTP